jgi:hypothetical protein
MHEYLWVLFFSLELTIYSCYKVTESASVFFVGLYKIGDLLFQFISVPVKNDWFDRMSSSLLVPVPLPVN